MLCPIQAWGWGQRHLTGSWGATDPAATRGKSPLPLSPRSLCSGTLVDCLCSKEWRGGGQGWKGGVCFPRCPLMLGLMKQERYSPNTCVLRASPHPEDKFAEHPSRACTELLCCSDFKQTSEEPRLPQNVSANTRLNIFILSVLVAFQFIIVLLVSLHKSTMHLY